MIKKAGFDMNKSDLKALKFEAFRTLACLRTQHFANLGVYNLENHILHPANPIERMNSRLSNSLFLVLLVWMVGISCSYPRFGNRKGVPGTLRLDVEMLWDGEPYAIGEVGMDHAGHLVQLQNVQTYVSRVELRTLDGQWIGNERKGEVHLIDFNVESPRIVEPFPEGRYNAIRFGLGLPPDINGVVSPIDYPNDDPLSVEGSAGMFWTWATGYIFMKYEGRVSPVGSEVLSEPISYHCGTNDSYREVTFEFDYDVWMWSEGLHVMPLQLDAAKALDALTEIDVIEYPITHNGPNDTLAYELMDNFAASWNLIQ